MMFTKMYRFGLLIAVSVLAITCVEPYEVDTEIFEDALVIDATITNEIKQHEILLGRTYLLEEFDPIPEENANVKIIDDLQNEYHFQETAPGRYVSVDQFAAQIDRAYQLLILANNGRSYTSETIQLPDPTPVQNLYASRTINENDEEGMSIFVGYELSENPQYYRYEYEEAYKIIAPQYVGERIVSLLPQVLTFPIEAEERVCYNNIASEGIITGSTVSASGDKLNQFRVRFINRNDHIISHRYTILVRQFVISKEAHDYFELLKKFSGQGSLLSQTQPGFFNGNIDADSSGEKVLGFFDVSSVSTERLFFNYADFFPNEALPPYSDSDCTPYVAGFGTLPSITELLNNNLVRFYAYNSINGEISVVPRECADCTVMGSPIVPEFWEE